MPTLQLGVKTFILAAACGAIACSTPDSSALFRPSEAEPIRTEAPVDDRASPDNPPGDVESGSAGAGGGASTRPPIVVSPVSSVTDAGLREPEPPEPAVVDAGVPSVPLTPDAGDEPPPPPPIDPPPPVEPECGGALLDGICWYLGELDQACNGVCATHGGVDPASSARIGTPEQGGSIESCAAILEALGEPSATLAEGFREDELGFGCHLFVDAEGTPSAWWLTAPAFSPAASDPSARLVCGCAE